MPHSPDDEVYVVFDSYPGVDGCRFVEIERADGQGSRLPDYTAWHPHPHAAGLVRVGPFLAAHGDDQARGQPTQGHATLRAADAMEQAASALRRIADRVAPDRPPAGELPEGLADLPAALTRIAMGAITQSRGRGWNVYMLGDMVRVDIADLSILATEQQGA